MLDNIGIIDMGSNSVRLILVKVNHDMSFRLMEEHKESIRLGDGFTENMTLKPHKIEAALKTMRMFKRLCDAQNVTKILAVATAAVRKAKNGIELIDRIKMETGIDMKVISGEEEAHLDFIAVSSSLSIKDALILDIGGGSFELIWMENRLKKESVSIPIGSIDFAEQFNVKDALSEDEEQKILSFISNHLKNIPWLEKAKNLPLIGVGGTLRNIGKIDMLRRKYPLDIIHGYEVPLNGFNFIYEEIKNLEITEKRSFPGLSSDRADIFIGSLVLVKSIIDFTKSTSLIISGKGVREGLFYSFLKDKNIIIDNPLLLSLENTGKNMGLDMVHMFQVRKLTKRLFDDLKEIHKIHEDIDKIIDAATILHDSGIIINYYNHHRNSFFVILNSQVNGLTHRELVMSAYIASFHRKNKSYENFETYKLLIDQRDIEIIKAVSVLLRIAESLDKSMSSVVSDLYCEIEKDKVLIKISAKEYPELEINDAITAYSQFKKVFKRSMVII